MKILSLFILFVVLFKETRHQFPIPILLATEEFIKPETLTEAGEAPSDVNANSEPQEADCQITQNSDKPPPSEDLKNSNTLSSESSIPNENDNKASSSSTPKCVREGLPIENPEITPVSHVDINLHSDETLTDLQQESKLNVKNETEFVRIPSAGDMEGNGSQTGTQTEKPEKNVKGEDEEPIPSYMEWAQKKQAELISSSRLDNGHAGPLLNSGGGAGQSGQASGSQSNGVRNTSSAPNTIDAKNFASPDCGAKVVQSNAETQNPGGVLSSSHDEYMLNKCGVRIWFVIELCEPLTIEKISLGNLELFSSSPKEIELGISDRYPTRDWAKLGPFTLPDSRAIHPVILPQGNSSTFGKFVKVTILSHHGSEHYCPISVVRVNGKSEYEVLESETTHQEDRNKEESALYEEQLEDQSKMSSQDPAGKSVGGIKDAVLNILNKAVQSIVRRGLTSGSTETEQNDLSLNSKCRSVLQCVPRSPMEQEIYTLLSCNSSDLLLFLSEHSPWCGWDYCHAIFSRQSIGLPWQPEGFFASLFGGPGVLHALCHYNKPLTEGCDPTSFTANGNNSVADPDAALPEALPDGYINESISVEGDSQVSSPIEQNGGHQEQESVPQHQHAEAPPLNINSGATETPVEQLIDIPSPQIPSTPSPAFTPQETQIPSPSGSQSQVDESHQQQQNQQSGGSTQQKESVFVRLTNRIKNLERNQSLTASYLEELSRRFKKQNEDNSISSEANKKTVNETRIRVLKLDEFYRQELQSLRRNLDDVRERLFTVQLQRSFLVLLCLFLMIVIVGGLCWIVRKFNNIQSQLNNIEQPVLPSIAPSIIPSSEPVTVKTENSSSKNNKFQIGRKRSNSDVTLSSITDKSKKLKKKNKKIVPDLKLHSNANVVVNNNGESSEVPASAPACRTTSTEILRSAKLNFGIPSVNVSAAPNTTKENIDPHLRNMSIPFDPNSNRHQVTPPVSISNMNGSVSFPLSLSSQSQQRPNTFVTKVDSPFSFSPFVDSGISTSGRFALLASPGPDSPIRRFQGSVDDSTLSSNNLVNVKLRSGSAGSSISSSSASTNNTTENKQRSIKEMLNGHHSSGQISNNGNHKKGGKKVGLKAFMPKIFDR